MIEKLTVIASDGSAHQYPEGFRSVLKGDWLLVQDETNRTEAQFFRPKYCMMRTPFQSAVAEVERLKK